MYRINVAVRKEHPEEIHIYVPSAVSFSTAIGEFFIKNKYVPSYMYKLEGQEAYYIPVIEGFEPDGKEIQIENLGLEPLTENSGRPSLIALKDPNFVPIMVLLLKDCGGIFVRYDEATPGSVFVYRVPKEFNYA